MDIFFLKILKNKGDKRRRRRKIYWYLPEYYNPLVRAVHILENFEVFYVFMTPSQSEVKWHLTLR